MNVDPLLIRLLFAVFAFAAGFAILIYIILWVVIPGSYDLNEVEVSKKMYRDPERKVLGGVSGGVASYFGIDIIVVRVLFIVLTFTGGLGLFLYIILWLILPEARTLTDRMQMQGEPVTLSNIESNIKKNQLEPDREEGALTKILLFPFRMLGELLRALARIIGPLAEAFRVLLGVFIVVVGLGLLISIITTGGVAFGIISSGADNLPWIMSSENDLSMPVDAMMRAFPGWVLTSAFIAALIPALFIVLLGISAVARRIVYSSTIGWSLLAIFVMCSVLLAVGIPKIVLSFSEHGDFEVENTYRPTGKTPILRIRETGLDNFDVTSLHLKGHASKEYKLLQIFSAKGSSRQRAIENAKMVTYQVDLQDSILTFDSNINFKPDAIFRGQELEMTLFIPYNTPFKIERNMVHLLDEYIPYEHINNETWEMTDRGLTCVSCPKPSETELRDAELRDFDELELNGIFDVRIYNSEEFLVELKGPDAEKLKYNIFRTGRKLVIDFEGKKNFNWDWDENKLMSDQVHISISMPDLKRIEARGFGNIDFDKFYQESLELEIQGPIDVKGEIDTRNLDIDLSAKAELELRGFAQSMNAEAQLASKINAYELEVQDANVEVRGASSAKINATQRLEIEEGVASDVDYRGTAEVIRNKE
jgi:phage shock protein PspC (stress-responsive transcriptional regulator)